MKKGLLIVALLCLICIPFSVLAFAEETEAPSESIVLLVGDETNAETGTYTWIDALQYAETNYAKGAYTVRLTKDIFVGEAFTINKPLKLTIDLAGYTLSSNTGSVKTDSKTGKQSWDSGVTVKLGSGSSNCVITTMTSVEGGTWNNVYKNSLNNATSYDSLFSISAGVSPLTFNFGGAGSKALTVNGNMLVTASSSSFKDDMIMDIHIDGGSYTLTNGIYQVQAKSTMTSCAIYNADVKNATVSVSSRLFWYNGSGSSLNPKSIMSFTNCTVKSRSKAVNIGNAIYTGSITMTGCTIENIVFDLRTASAKSVVFGEGCVFTTPDATTTISSKKYTTFNADKTGFANENTSCAQGCVIVNADDGLLRVMKASDACRIDFVTLAGTETRYWLAGSTPVYKGTKTLTINDHEYTITFPNVSEATTAGESYTYNCKLSGGVKLQTSLTLYSGIDLNVYVPAWAEIEKINGQLVTEFSTVTNDDTVYYKVPFTLAPKNAGETQTVSIVVKYNDQSVALEAREVSVVNYVNKLAALYPNSETSELALSLLAYAKETRLYFYDIDAEEGDEVTKAIDAVLAEHEYSVTEWTAEGNTNIKELPTDLQYIKAMALTLGDTPGVSVAVLEDVEAVTIAGVTYTVDPTKTTTVEGITCCYVDAEFGAFAMMDDFVIEANGETITINLDTYLYRVDAPSYAGALYGYVSAAKAYITK